MSKKSETPTARPGRGAGEDADARLRISNIIESAELEAAEKLAQPPTYPIRRRRGGWHAKSRQAFLVSRLIAIVWVFAIFVGWPIGNLWAWIHQTGSAAGWSILNAVTFEAFLLATFAPLLTLLIGYIVSRSMEMLSAAESIASAAQHFISPDEKTVGHARAVSEAVRGQMETLNVGLDTALMRLATVEAMIRQHVEAIENAGTSIESRASGAVRRIAEERARLIELTENLNVQADSFAAAIAAKAQASIEAIHSADDVAERAQSHLDERLTRLDDAARRALTSFTALTEALTSADESVRATTGAIERSAAEQLRASEQAKRVAESAAESAARNAANVGAAAMRAAEGARKAADETIEIAAREADRVAQSAVEATTRESQRIAEAARRAVETVQEATQAAADSASEGAARTTQAASSIVEAAQRASEAAAKASATAQEAREAARRSADAATQVSEESAKRSETRNRALAEARAALEQENARLESLIEEQRRRADRLADAIASQTDRLSKLAETQLRDQEAHTRFAEAQAALTQRADEEARAAEAAEAKARETARRQKEAEEARRARENSPARRAEPVLELGADQRPGAKPAAPSKRRPDSGARRGKSDISWREILEATDEAAPLDLAAASVKAPEPAPEAQTAVNAIRIINRLQEFTFNLEGRLYGEPPQALQERFQRGDRNVFANRLLRLNEADVKRRIRAETARDKSFERELHQFLQGFERLLEDATTSQTADEDLEEYLSSPLGRVYLLIGATVGYFA